MREPPVPEEEAATPEPRRRGPLRRLYDWTLSWSNRRSGPAALFGISAAESSFFPIPPDVLLIPLALGRPSRALWFALLCTVGSILGGVIGYGIGVFLYEQVGQPILEFYNAMDDFDRVGHLYRANLILALGTAGFTPIPYKVFTIAAGAFAIPLLPFIVISFVSRGLRFFAVATLIYFFGPPIKLFIDRYFNILSIIFAVLLIGGFVVVGRLL